VFDVVVSEIGVRTQVVVRGELDMLTAPELRSALRACADQGHSDVVVDLAGVAFLDAQGLGVLVEARKRLDAHHRSLTIVSPSAPARRVLDLTGLTTLFSVTPVPTPG
jgi:anti-sigma B factor antagonist